MADCLPQVHACAMRVTDLDTNGVPLPGPDHIYVTDALTTLTFTPEIADGDEIEEKNACGAICVSYVGDPSFKFLGIELELCTPDPYLEAMLGRGNVLEVPGRPAGYAYPPLGELSSAVLGGAVSIELWAKRVLDGELDPDYPYAWWAIPKITKLRPAGREFAAAAQKPTFSGNAYENTNWFDGPLNDWPTSSDRVAQWVPTATLPTVQCGPQALVAS